MKIMKKKYIEPATRLVKLEIQSLMVTQSELADVKKDGTDYQLGKDEYPEEDIDDFGW